MPSLGLPELIIILFIALIIFGPKKLPEMGRAIGTSIKEFKKATKEMMKDEE
ncbi:twin-arginine translocase TatA/TatE family subunit [Wukongibacter baidiensis]|uniref:twin-arginine translocase TatA/TatE family subunit n=1 Tax=Wukongibacter baidiensis TaxID=1723361 RepID=UPI003D7F8AB6